MIEFAQRTYSTREEKVQHKERMSFLVELIKLLNDRLIGYVFQSKQKMLQIHKSNTKILAQLYLT